LFSFSKKTKQFFFSANISGRKGFFSQTISGTKKKERTYNMKLPAETKLTFWTSVKKKQGTKEEKKTC
jgi:hypothetical protein